MAKIPLSTLNLRQFMLRQEVINLYREILRTIRLVPEKSSREELCSWARQDFRANLQLTDEMAIKMLIKEGKRSLSELQTNLRLSGFVKDDKKISPKITNQNLDEMAELPKRFMFRQEVLKLYRELFRAIRLVPKTSKQRELCDLTRQCFRANLHQRDNMVILMLLKHGKRHLTELKECYGNTAKVTKQL